MPPTGFGCFGCLGTAGFFDFTAPSKSESSESAFRLRPAGPPAISSFFEVRREMLATFFWRFASSSSWYLHSSMNLVAFSLRPQDFKIEYWIFHSTHSSRSLVQISWMVSLINASISSSLSPTCFSNFSMRSFVKDQIGIYGNISAKLH